LDGKQEILLNTFNIPRVDPYHSSVTRSETDVDDDYYYYFLYLLTYLLTYLLQPSFHSVAVVLTLVQTKQIRINMHKQNNTKTTFRLNLIGWKTGNIVEHI
jgi:hypothetical protein